MIDHLKRIDKKYLYIDFNDPNLFFDKIDENELKFFIKQNGIEIVVFDHYENQCKNITYLANMLVIVSRVKLKKIDSLDISFIELFPLDYEEFIAFSKSTNTSLLNNFLKSGTLPEMAISNMQSNDKMKRFFYSNFSEKEQKLLIILAKYTAQRVTINQIYLYSKEKFKISKDWLYKKMREFQDEKIVVFIEDRHHKSSKKMIMFDFAFAKYLTLSQGFIMQFDTLIILAMLKHKYQFETFGNSGYITKNNELILLAPFDTEENIWKKTYLKQPLYTEYNIKIVTIITVANRYNYEIKGIKFEGLPFEEWTILND